MKVTIEHPHLTATTDSWVIVSALANMRQSGAFAEPIPEINTDIPTDSNPDNIPSSAYLVITADAITCDGKPTNIYNGEEIWDAKNAICYFAESIRLFKQEHDIDVVELHCLQSSTVGEYAKSDNPVPDTNGIYSWCRIKTKDGRLSRWVFRSAYSSVADCRSYCAIFCGYFVRNGSAFRAGLFGSLGN